MQVFDRCAVWEPKKDSKLEALLNLVTKKHKTEKVLVFSQFSDTVQYLNRQLVAAGVKESTAATGESENLTELVYRFSPISNKKTIPSERGAPCKPDTATDVLS